MTCSGAGGVQVPGGLLYLDTKFIWGSDGGAALMSRARVVWEHGPRVHRGVAPSPIPSHFSSPRLEFACLMTASR